MFGFFRLLRVAGGPPQANPLQNFLNHPLMRLLNDPRVWGPVGGVLGAYLFVRGFSLLQRRRLLMNTPRSSVRAAALGPVEVSGQATGPYTLVSPLSLSDCYYYRLVTTCVSYTQKHKTVEEAAPLFLDDGTGKLMVDPYGAEFQFAPSAAWESGNFPEYLRHFLLQHEMNSDNVAAVKEFCLRPGESIVVFGTLQENPWAEARTKHNDSAERIGPGFLSQVAADVQRRRAFETLDAARDSGATVAALSAFDLHPPVILSKGSAPFFISQNSVRDLVGGLGWQVMLYIWGGPALALFCAYSLLRRLLML